MIRINSKEDCCGCAACVQVCPLKCISFQEDNEGFLYPKVDEIICSDCRLCESVCPVINKNVSKDPKSILAVKNKNNDIRLKSSSGGVFSLLSEKILNQGGVVFGARFNENWEVIHDYTETYADLELYRGSKYVQSNVGDTFKKTKCFLKQGRKVLFSGTPCQIAGLNNFLGSSYDNLFTIDIVCHGVPSPKVWKLYLQELSIKYCKTFREDNTSINNYIKNIKEISFRDKKMGWKKYRLVIKCNYNKEKKYKIICSESSHKNIYMRGFLRDLYLRPSCHSCPSKSFNSKSDITLADYWGINKLYPEFDDDKGINLVFVNSEKGESLFDNLNIDCIRTTYEEGLLNNPSIERSVKKNKNRDTFFLKIDSGNISNLIHKYSKLTTLKRLRKFIIIVLVKTSLIKILKRNGK